MPKVYDENDCALYIHRKVIGAIPMQTIQLIIKKWNQLIDQGILKNVDEHGCVDCIGSLRNVVPADILTDEIITIMNWEADYINNVLVE